MVAAALARTRRQRADVRSLGLTDVPACGGNAEVLAHHGLDAVGIVRAVSSSHAAVRVQPCRPPSHRQHVPESIFTGSTTPEVAVVERRRRSRSGVRWTTALSRSVARGAAADVASAIDAAARTADAWGRLPAPKRGEILGRAAALLRARRARVRRASCRPKPASRGRTPPPKSPRPPTSRCSWKAKAAASTARR